LHRPMFAFVRSALLAHLARVSLPHPANRPFRQLGGSFLLG
jgi:hypothetical protein